ncbi:hypothetical protein [Burkholderia pyrrocinia]|uniref:hypothetical protein n=1 Tax=Burkholderia pyrrocinia TaxID=60550 RepID=UPI00158D97E1|nr:hypothetical protein [Burkholderia pyrrocinia]
MSEKLVPRRQYTKEFKMGAIRLAENAGQHEAALWRGMPVTTLGNRGCDHRSGNTDTETGPTSMSSELSGRRPVDGLKRTGSSQWKDCWIKLLK